MTQLERNPDANCLSATEIVCALGLADWLVGVSLVVDGIEQLAVILHQERILA